jgi:tRNA A37 threonylcarbamoyladenosine biosynthesis protein TsaE
VMLEWPDRLGDALRADRIDVAIAIDGPTARTVTFTARGAAHAALVGELGRRIARAG